MKRLKLNQKISKGLILLLAITALNLPISFAGNPSEKSEQVAKVQLEKMLKTQYQGKKFWASADASDLENASMVEVSKIELKSISTPTPVDAEEYTFNGTFLMTLKQAKKSQVVNCGFTSAKVVGDKKFEMSDTSKEYFVNCLKDYLHTNDPIETFRNDAKIISAVQKREYYIGMPAKAMIAAVSPMKVGFCAQRDLNCETFQTSDGDTIDVVNGIVASARR